MKASLLQDWLFCRDITSVICPFVKDYPVVSAVNPLDASLFIIFLICITAVKHKEDRMKTPVAREVIRSVCRVNGCIPADKSSYLPSI